MLRPTKRDSLLNSIRAMFPFQCGISEFYKGSIFSERQNRGISLSRKMAKFNTRRTNKSMRLMCEAARRRLLSLSVFVGMI